MFNKVLLDKLLSEPLFNSVADIPLDEYRNLTIDRLKFLIQFLKINIVDMILDHKSFLAIMNTLHLIDTSLAIAFGVHYGLYGGSLINFSSEYNDIDEYVRKLNTGEHIGCLAITEIGHGSNLKELSTTATYHLETRTFSINSTSPDSYKCWIGNAKFATHCIMLAKLIIDNNKYDLHPFIVDLSSPGVTIIDNGCKNGLNGVANCVIIFNNVVIPERNLLGKFGFIRDGQYLISDKYRNNSRARFADLLSTLSGGRLVLSSGAAALSMQALMKTYHYGQIRKQFNFNTLKSNQETAIIRYPTFFSGLFLAMIKSYFLSIMINIVGQLGVKYYAQYNVLNKDIHILTSTVKILGSELADNTLRLCRTLCAGNGYLHINGFGSKFNDVDIYKTFEGDNTLLRLEVAGHAIETFVKHHNLNGSSLSNVSFFIRQKSQDLMWAFRHINVRTFDGMTSALRYCEEYLCVEFLQKIRASKGSYVTAWNKNLLLVTSIANLRIINTSINILGNALLDNDERYLLRYFILHCIKEQSFILSRLGLLSNSHFNDIETMINESNLTIYNSVDPKTYNENQPDYFKLVFSKYFNNLGSPNLLLSKYPTIFTISYPGDNDWIKTYTTPVTESSADVISTLNPESKILAKL